MSKVYVVQDPDGKEIIPAKEFGELHIILTGKETSSLALSKLEYAMRAMRQDDYILLIGSPLNIGLAMHVALTKTGGRARVLVWQRQTYTYKIEHINEYPTGSRGEPAHEPIESTTQSADAAADNGPGAEVSEGPGKQATGTRGGDRSDRSNSRGSAKEAVKADH